MSEEKFELASKYDPKQVEEKWYSTWTQKGYFHADEKSDKKPFVMVIPPPNVTGILHIGHALNNTIQDILIRWRRMQGYNACWVPGTDHAGIATQNVVERQLKKEGKTRHDLGRDKFIDRVWEWRKEYGGTIIHQLKKMGCSCDWPRERFTMDEGLSKAVREVFVRLYKEGLIYRGTYIVNWCPRCYTALSDDEAEPQDSMGHLWHIRYPIEGAADEYVIVATTRPETMLGDTAVAVHPEDKRYKHLIGKNVILPLVNRVIPVIADNYVDPKFGTGCLKITPAHDPNDFQIGLKHNLAQINVMTPDAKINDEGGKYKGMDRDEARKAVVEDLKAQGYLLKIEDYAHAVRHCYRCNTIVEPYLSLQWFVKMKPLAVPAIAAVREGKIHFHPQNWENTYFAWMENVRDWCISRQLWWGHRIPVWYCEDCGKETVATKDPDKCEHCGSANIKQDSDVLDTWFSSALWPFSTLGWPQDTDEVKKFYPTSVLSTSHDIIFFWVARMIMMGIKFSGDVPFKDVYFHALVRDAQGRKMSKSLGNAINPLKITDEFGTDSLRFTLCALAAQGRNINLDPKRIEGYRNFTNKIWNASRFLLMQWNELDTSIKLEPDFELSLADRWILSRLNKEVQETNRSLEEFAFDSAASTLYHFLWHEYCDWYLEFIKPQLKGDMQQRMSTLKVATSVLENVVRLLHPIMPFITEEIWQNLPGKPADSKESIMISSYPAYDTAKDDADAETEMLLIQNLIDSIRNIRGEMHIPPSMKTQVFLKVADTAESTLLKAHAEYFHSLVPISELQVAGDVNAGKHASMALVKDIEIHIPLPVEIIESEITRLKKEVPRLEKEIENVAKKLANPQFCERAPEAVVAKEKEKAEQYKLEIVKLKEKLAELEN
jgi:valyl-tRNA synthetase